MQSSAAQPLLKAALWDMDGTIVDTEPYWIEAEHALVAAHGGQWSHEKAMQLVGQSLVFSAGILQDAGVAAGAPGDHRHPDRPRHQPGPHVRAVAARRP